ncbi:MULTISPECIES: endo-1,4-beta-xylanase [Bacillaceae]|uniref:Beta-xylanase n=1 Tax=Evansella alkalicola TaxID=745819 RepID=A0ABS6JTP0_9BACI|nr:MULTISPECIES: endo-1,4-beta-xylanase [Bacillaceae]MBU9721780.1 endo-1,4-beta-xylanase [Bacillus alkalicola]
MRNKHVKSFLIKLLVIMLVLPPGLFHFETNALAEGDSSDENIETVYHESFDEGTGIVEPSGPAQLDHVSDLIFDGNDNGQGIHVTGRSDGWHGVDIPFSAVGMEDGNTYTVTVKGYIDEDVEVPEGGQALFQNIESYEGFYESADYVAGEAFTLSGEYTVDASEDIALRVQSNEEGQEVDFYLGDILITKSTSSNDNEIPDGEEIAVFTDFEDGTLQGWEPREGPEELSVNPGTGRDSEYSLLIENRQGSFYSAMLDFLDNMHEGFTYDISVWVKLAEGEEPTELQVSRAETDSDGTNYWPPVVTPRVVTDEEWVLLEGTYTLTAGVTDLFFYVEEPYDEDQDSGVSFYLDDFKAEAQVSEEIEDIPELREVFADYFDIGAAIERDQMFGRHGEMLKKHYNMLVAENVMKPEAIQPEEGQFSWSRADAMLDFAEENGMKTRFHTLVWHSQSPNWMFEDAEGNPMVVNGEVTDPDNIEANKQLLLDRIEDHIVAVVGRYHDRIDSWDVVNEVIVAHEDDGYRRSEYYLITGTDFIRHAFEITKRELETHNASGKLYYNDYSTHSPQKRDYIFDMIHELDLVEDGLIDGIGHQTHINIEYPPMEQITDSIEMFGEIGLDNEITELDVSIYTNDNQNYDGFDNIPDEVFETQADRYEDLFNEFRRLEDYISSVVFWGIGDDHTWLHDFPVSGRTNAPFVFDHNLQSKPAYWAIIEGYEESDPDPDDIERDLTPIKEVYEDYFMIGNIISDFTFEGVSLDLLNLHYNLVTAENAMKPEYAYNDDGEFDFADQNTLVDQALEEGFDIHGHVLVWHNQSRDWLWQDEDGEPLSREEALANMEEHIETNILNYGDSITSWDVVNEAIVVNSSNLEDWQASLRDTGWLRAIGDDYVEQAFRITKRVIDENDLDITLYYNDYNDHVQDKAQVIYYMVKDINERYAAENDGELLIGGVGMQGHYSIDESNVAERVRMSLERFISLGVEIGVTELDIMAGSDDELTEQEERAQAYLFAQLFELYKEHADHISRVTFWGLADSQSWRGDRNPTLFDHNMQAKEAYYAVIDPETYIENYDEDEIDPTREGNGVFGTPVIDGEIDDVWNDAPVLPINRYQSAWEGATGEGRVLWDYENLYVLVEVNDPELDKSSPEAHEQDSVEVFLDQLNSKSVFYEDGHGQYRVNFDNETSFNPGSIGEGFESATHIHESGEGYTVEIKIPFTEITPENNTEIGFDLQINDAEDGTRRSVATWNDLQGSGWSDPSVFGNLTLVYSVDEDDDSEYNGPPGRHPDGPPGHRDDGPPGKHPDGPPGHRGEGPPGKHPDGPPGQRK